MSPAMSSMSLMVQSDPLCCRLAVSEGALGWSGVEARRHMLVMSQPSWPRMLAAVTRGITRPDVASLLTLTGGDVCEKVAETNVASILGFSLL